MNLSVAAALEGTPVTKFQILDLIHIYKYISTLYRLINNNKFEIVP